MGALSRLSSSRLVALGYLIVFVILCIIAPIAGAVFGAIGAVTLLPYLFVATARSHRERLEAARTDLEPGEEVRFWWRSGFPSMGSSWVVITTERLKFPRLAFGSPRTRSIPFSEIYLADTSERSIGVGAYGGGLIVGTTLSSRYLELDLINGDVVRIKMDRPQVLHQRLNDAIVEWAQRQTAQRC